MLSNLLTGVVLLRSCPRNISQKKKHMDNAFLYDMDKLTIKDGKLRNRSSSSYTVFSNAISDLPLSGNIVNMKCCKYRKIVQDLVNWTPCLLRLNPAWMEAPLLTGKWGSPPCPAKMVNTARQWQAKKGDTLESSEIFHESYEAT